MATLQWEDVWWESLPTLDILGDGEGWGRRGEEKEEGRGGYTLNEVKLKTSNGREDKGEERKGELGIML